MVKELDDAPRDDLAIVLDQDPDGVAGPRRAIELRRRGSRRRRVGTRAGAVEPARRPRRDGARSGATCGSASAGHDWEVALDALATVEPVAGARSTGRCVRRPARSHGRERSSSSPVAPDRAVEPLLELRRGGRSVSLVIVASETYAGRPRHAQQPAALRASAQGVLVAVVSAETPIAEALAGRSAGAASG